MCGLQEGPKELSIERGARGLPSDEADSGNGPRAAQARNFSLSSSSFLVALSRGEAAPRMAFKAGVGVLQHSCGHPLRWP
jgi:hypothetical protein